MTYTTSRIRVDTKYLLQHGTGYCGNMLKHVQPWHQQYCNKHNLAYVPLVGHIPTRNVGRKPRPQEWQKPQLLVNWLRQTSEGDVIAYVDPDAVVINPTVNIIDILPPDKDIAIAPSFYAGKTRYNAGVLIMRNNCRTLDLWNTINEMGPGISNYAHDEGRLNRLIWDGHPVKVYDLPGEYNAFRYTKFVPENVVIKAWHGEPRDTVDRRVKETVWQLYEQQHSQV